MSPVHSPPMCSDGLDRATVCRRPKRFSCDNTLPRYLYIDSGRSLRQDTLRRKMRRPQPIKSLADVPQGVLRFNNLYREFTEAGGEQLTKDTLKSDLYETLPSTLRDQLLSHTIDPDPKGIPSGFCEVVVPVAAHFSISQELLSSPSFYREILIF